MRTASALVAVIFSLGCGAERSVADDPDGLDELAVDIQGVTFIEVEGGTFTMGDEELVHSVPETEIVVNQFLMMQTEVTLGIFRRCVLDGVCRIPTERGLCNYAISPDDHPVNCITGQNAELFAEWFGHGARLPSEAEWEFVATNGGTTDYPWGAGPPTCERIVRPYEPNLEDGADCIPHPGTLPVCSRPLGNTGRPGVFCDLLGSLSEIMADDWHPVLDCSVWPAEGGCELGGAIPVDGLPWTNEEPSEWRVGRGWEYFNPDPMTSRTRGVAGYAYSEARTGFRLVIGGQSWTE